MLASHALKSNQLHHLATALRHRRATAKDMAPLQPLRLAVVSNGTTDLLAAALAATGARYGFDVDIIEGLFGQATQEGLDPQSIVNSAKPDYVLLALDYRALPMETRPADETSEQAAL
ncbi:MAG: hypothetical protein RBS99_19760, partial [Rhodospirillales bacterium]|nr:hypothetical protein [Rhodospirillales bacterium]